MSLIKPGIDSHHIIQEALNAKSLSTLSQIEDLANPKEDFKHFSDIPKNKFPFYLNSVPKEIKNESADKILNYAGIQVKNLKDGTKAISEYCQPSIKYSFTDAGINESKLIENVSTVLGNLNLSNTGLKDTGKIATVQGDVIIGGKHSLENISSLKKIYGSVFVNADSKESALKILKSLKFKPTKVTGKLILLPSKF